MKVYLNSATLYMAYNILLKKIKTKKKPQETKARHVIVRLFFFSMLDDHQFISMVNWLHLHSTFPAPSWFPVCVCVFMKKQTNVWTGDFPLISQNLRQKWLGSIFLLLPSSWNKWRHFHTYTSSIIRAFLSKCFFFFLQNVLPVHLCLLQVPNR